MPLDTHFPPSDHWTWVPFNHGKEEIKSCSVESYPFCAPHCASCCSRSLGGRSIRQTSTTMQRLRTDWRGHGKLLRLSRNRGASIMGEQFGDRANSGGVQALLPSEGPIFQGVAPGGGHFPGPDEAGQVVSSQENPFRDAENRSKRGKSAWTPPEFLTFQAGKWTSSDSRPAKRGTYTTDPTCNPAHLTLTYMDEQGTKHTDNQIYRIDGNTVVIACIQGFNPTNSRPTSFDGQGGRLEVITYKRARK